MFHLFQVSRMKQVKWKLTQLAKIKDLVVVTRVEHQWLLWYQSVHEHLFAFFVKKWLFDSARPPPEEVFAHNGVNFSSLITCQVSFPCSFDELTMIPKYHPGAVSSSFNKIVTNVRPNANPQQWWKSSHWRCPVLIDIIKDFVV